ncbi:MAG: radical SAM protein, partial [Chitinivibrionales bacterium]
RIVLGGFTASFFADEIIREFSEIDYIIKGDAEIPLVELVRCLKGLGDVSHVPNLLYRTNKNVISNPQTFSADQALLNRINFTDFDLIENRDEFIFRLKTWVRVKDVSNRLHKALLGSKSLYPVYLGRGCPYSCSYCGGNNHAQRAINNRAGVILRSVENVVQSLLDIHRHGFDGASFNYDPLVLEIADAFYLEVFAQLRRLAVKMFVEIERWKLPSEEFIIAFKETFAPGSFVSLSLNHPDESLRKKNNLFMYGNDNLEACLRVFERRQVNVMLFFACGLPFETSETLRALRTFVKGIKKKYRYVRCKVSLIEIEPCSDLSVNPGNYGISVVKKSFLDYYRYHAGQHTNHYQEIGYTGDGAINKKTLTRFYCSHFCKVFKAGMFSPLFCHLAGLAWKTGTVRLIDKTIISRKKNGPATSKG